MTGPFKTGLYRIITKDSIRFFRVNYSSSSGLWKVREYVGGDLNSRPISTVKLTKTFWKQLVYW